MSGADLMDWDMQAYHVQIVTQENKEVILLAMGVDKVSSEILNTINKPALKIFPQVNSKQLSKSPSERVELPIGLNYLGIQPKEIPRVDGLMLRKSQITSRVPVGQHSS